MSSQQMQRQENVFVFLDVVANCFFVFNDDDPGGACEPSPFREGMLRQ